MLALFVACVAVLVAVRASRASAGAETRISSTGVERRALYARVSPAATHFKLWLCIHSRDLVESKGCTAQTFSVAQSSHGGKSIPGGKVIQLRTKPSVREHGADSLSGLVNAAPGPVVIDTTRTVIQETTRLRTSRSSVDAVTWKWTDVLRFSESKWLSLLGKASLLRATVRTAETVTSRSVADDVHPAISSSKSTGAISLRMRLAVAFRQVKPVHWQLWLCVHKREASWTDPNAPYYGGLQMGWWFMRTYAPRELARWGTADHWPPAIQVWVAERAYAREHYSQAWLRGQWPATSPPCLAYA